MARETRPKDYPKLKNYQPSKFMLPTSHYDIIRYAVGIKNLADLSGKCQEELLDLCDGNEKAVKKIMRLLRKVDSKK